MDDGGCVISLSAEEGIRALDEMGDEVEQRETLAYLIEALDRDRLSDRRRFQ